MSAVDKAAPLREQKAGANVQRAQSPLEGTRAREVSELIGLVARSLRPIFPLETDCGFDELLRTLDQHGL